MTSPCLPPREEGEPEVRIGHLGSSTSLEVTAQPFDAATVEGLMQLLAEYGQCRWSEGSSGATYLDRMGERRSREEAAELSLQIRAYAERLGMDAYASGRRDEQEELSSVLPGVTYMDPPDGGSPTILEQLQRQAKDAARYVWLRPRLYGCDFDWNESGETVIIFGWPKGHGISADCDRTIDAARGVES